VRERERERERERKREHTYTQYKTKTNSMELYFNILHAACKMEFTIQIGVGHFWTPIYGSPQSMFMFPVVEKTDTVLQGLLP
jgi:hypothetical protein